jgi:hypothetical protein
MFSVTNPSCRAWTLSAMVGLSLAISGGCKNQNENKSTAQAEHARAEALACKTPEDNGTATASVIAPAAAAAPKYASFGSPTKLADDQAITVKQLMTNVEDYRGKFVRVTGTVDKVCTKKGCWLTLKQEGADQGLFVKFPDPAEGRLIPLDAVGKRAAVEGIVKVRDIPPEAAKHYAEESGATAEQLAKITGPQKQITLASPSAQVEGVESGQK